MIQHECALNSLCQVREARHKRPRVIGFDLQKLSRLDKPIERDGTGEWGWEGLARDG